MNAKNSKESLCNQYEFRHSSDKILQPDLIEWLNENCSKWCFQEERGDSGYQHWQGNFSLIKKRRKGEIISQLFTDKVKPFMHIAPLSNNACKLEHFYSLKADTRIAGPWTNITDGRAKYIPRQYRDKVFRPWQENLLEISQTFDDRAIYYIHDPVGNEGKSTCAAMCDLLHGAVDLPPCLDGERLIASACDILMARELREPKIMFIDMPRTLGKEKLNSLFAAIEQIKKGKVYDMRHSYREWWFDSPAIWVFSNDPPPESAMSRDRWRFYSIGANGLEPVVSSGGGPPPPTVVNGWVEGEVS